METITEKTIKLDINEDFDFLRQMVDVFQFTNKDALEIFERVKTQTDEYIINHLGYYSFEDFTTRDIVTTIKPKKKYRLNLGNIRTINYIFDKCFEIEIVSKQIFFQKHIYSKQEFIKNEYEVYKIYKKSNEDLYRYLHDMYLLAKAQNSKNIKKVPQGKE